MEGDFQSFKKGKSFANISSQKQPSENDLVVSGEVGEGGRGGICACQTTSSAGGHGGEKKSALCLNWTWFSKCCGGSEDREMGHL